MSGLGSIGFVSPLILAGLIVLPVIWLLLRYTPPRPHQERFPPTRILSEIIPTDETRATSPWWLTLLRMLLAAAIIVALARPLLDPTPARLEAEGPVMIVMDTGWAAQPAWPAMTVMATDIIAEAEANDRRILVVETGEAAALSAPGNADEARNNLQTLRPRPHAPEHAAILERLGDLQPEDRPGEIFYLSSGIAYDAEDVFSREIAAIFPEARAVIVTPSSDALPLAFSNAVSEGAAIDVTIQRAESGSALTRTIEARDAKGRLMEAVDIAFESGATTATQRLELPIELRNDVASLRIADAPYAGAVHLVDDRFRKRLIGLVSGASSDVAQPLTDPLHYIRSALETNAELRIPSGAESANQIDELIDARVNALILADIGNIPESVAEKLDGWLRDGGILIRFSGPRLSGDHDDFLPVMLRPESRILGGPLSWAKPQGIGGTKEGSPLDLLKLPDDIVVNQQILAEPGIGLADATWAWLEDGTPLVTGAPRGLGQIILFHVTADASWSNLPLTGLFVEMLERVALPGVTPHSGTGTGSDPLTLRPIAHLAANGVLGDAPGDAAPLPANATGRATAEFPPGFYGVGASSRAVNVLNEDESIAPVAAASFETIGYPSAQSTDLSPYVWITAFILLLADTAAVLLLGGLNNLRRRFAAASVAALLALAPFTGDIAHAQEKAQEEIEDKTYDQRLLNGLSRFSLGYVLTGNEQVDAISEAGMRGLSTILYQRTAIEPGPPVAIDFETDETAFFALIYWPIAPDSPPASDEALRRADAFMKQGGTILFDTRDQLDSATRLPGSGNAYLADMLKHLDLPEIEPVSPEHVLTKSFYLLQDFPGRYQGAPLWVERLGRATKEGERPARGNDGVSPVMVTGNDFAAAWATDPRGQPLFPVTGGERQREMSYRVGVNIVMYTLTGNYKADQVHIQTLLDRLGQ